MKKSMSDIRIGRLGNSQLIRFAADELLRCLKSMEPGAAVAVMKFEKVDMSIENVIWVGIDESFSDVPKVASPYYDDAIYINIKNSRGVITGSNERSVLIGVYRFLKEVGCAFVRPGKEGEIFPYKSVGSLNVFVKEAAAYRHRSICIDGSNSYENITDMIDYIPKIGMSGYFMQFFSSYTILAYWYESRYNEGTGRSIGNLEAKKMKLQFEDEITKRGLLYHAVGHGWTGEPFGLDGSTHDANRTYDVPEENLQYLAQVDGKRGIWRVPLATQICYGNPKAREKIVQFAADYCQNTPIIDFLHLWLADELNVMCECGKCAHISPSDHYVILLNELDAEFTRRNIKTKVVFLIYLELLWAPVKERFINPDRFVLMFAPISRKYDKSLLELGEIPEPTPAYELNKTVLSPSFTENIALLKKWQEIFNQDSFDFDYHIEWEHFYDPGTYNISRVVFEDMQNLDKIGLNGMVSCQVQRGFMPTGLPTNMMAAALWDREIDFETTATNYLNSAFGEDGIKVRKYLKAISAQFIPEYISHRKEPVDGKILIDRLSKIEGIVSDFSPLMDSNINAQSGVIKNSWTYLQAYSKVCIGIAKTLMSKANGNEEEAKENWAVVKDFLIDNEAELQNVLDYHMFFDVVGYNIFNMVNIV
jgi:hypothetical protein